jgi:geranylgeranyl diphosphate synthase type I
MATTTAGPLAAPPLLERYRSEIDAELRASVESREAAFSPQVRYHMGWVDARGAASSRRDGKALRPSLLLLICEGLGGDRHRALPLAAAVQLVHDFSLLHDDIQDGDRERRHRPTVWALWGVPQAINVGDAVFSLAMFALHDALQAGLSPPHVLEAHSALARACLEMIEGQYMDLSFEESEIVSPDDYMDMAERKTGALMGASLELGAIAAGADDFRAAACRTAGRNLGLAFQFRDDYLGIWGRPSETGKEAGGDILRRKKSLPVVYGLSQTSPQGAEFRRIYGLSSLSAEDVERARRLLTELDASTFTRHLAEERCQAALSELRSAGLSAWALEEFRLLTDYLVQTQGI